jgi:DNA polymerase III delta subunit
VDTRNGERDRRNMLISDLKNNIVSGNINNFYIFTGEEEGIMDIYIKQISTKLNLQVKWADSIQDVSKQVNLKSIVNVKYLYLVRQDKAISKQEKLWTFLKEGINANYLILIEPNLDKKTNFYKFFEDYTIKFENLYPDMLAQYGSRKCPGLSKQNLATLAEWCSCSYNRFMLELDKVNCISQVLKRTPDESFMILVKDNAIHKDTEFDVFAYVDYILSRNKYACYKELDLIKAKKCEVMLVSLLMTAFRNLVLFKNDGGGKGVCDRTGLLGWQIKNAIQMSEYYTVDECESILLFLQDTEVKIKTGVINPEIVVQYILSEVL